MIRLLMINTLTSALVAGAIAGVVVSTKSYPSRPDMTSESKPEMVPDAGRQITRVDELLNAIRASHSESMTRLREELA